MIRTGVVAIVIEGDRSVSVSVQEILSAHGDVIVGRMGVPDKESGENVIALIVKGSVEEISALTGKLGRLKSIQVKSALTAAKTDNG